MSDKPASPARWKSELAQVRYDEPPLEDIEIHRDFWIDLPYSSGAWIGGVTPDPWSGPPTGKRSWRAYVCEHDLADGVAQNLDAALDAVIVTARKFVDDMAAALGGKVAWGDKPARPGALP